VIAVPARAGPRAPACFRVSGRPAIEGFPRAAAPPPRDVDWAAGFRAAARDPDLAPFATFPVFALARAVRRRFVWDTSLMSKLRSNLLWVALAVLAAGGGVWVAKQTSDQAPQLTSGTWLPQPRPLSGFSLTDESGQPFTTESLKGHSTLVFFGFTHCPDVCPTTLAKLSQVVKAAGVPNLKVLLVSVDPQRDTPEQLERYVHAFNPDFQAVTGKPEEIERVTQQFNVAAVRVDMPGGNYTVDHSAVVFLLNDRGERVAIFTPPLEIEPIAADLRNVAERLRS
jgi:protein SCO1